MNAQQTIKLSPEESKRHAWQLRQKDTGWGRAFAQAWIPFYGLYYAITRRTITPFLYALAFGLMASVVVGVAKNGESEENLEAMGQLQRGCCVLGAAGWEGLTLAEPNIKQ